ncbi:MAG TPA: AsmA family protein, partial [Geobacteraceae bacterium]|nr:AsmA family protein [Geobacteraceae bacterium]
MTSRKLFIITAIIIGVLVLLAGGALLLVKVLVTPEMIRKNVLPRVEEAMDRRIDMADAKIGLFSGIALSGLKVYEKDGKGPFVSLREARLHYQILPLLSRRVVVDEIVLDTPVIHIVRNSDGSFNFSDLLRKEKPETPAREEKTPFSFAVARIKVSDGRVIYDDRKGISGKPFVYKAQDINIGVKNFTPDRPFPMELTATVPGADLGFSGTVERIKGTPMVDGQVTVNAADLAKVVAGLPPAVSAKIRTLSPRGRITSKIHISGEVNTPIAMLKEGEVRLEQVKLSAGGQTPELSGKIDIVNGSLVSKDFAVVLGKNRLNLLIKTS